jgi:hypothetical protein
MNKTGPFDPNLMHNAIIGNNQDNRNSITEKEKTISKKRFHPSFRTLMAFFDKSALIEEKRFSSCSQSEGMSCLNEFSFCMIILFSMTLEMDMILFYQVYCLR